MVKKTPPLHLDQSLLVSIGVGNDDDPRSTPRKRPRDEGVDQSPPGTDPDPRVLQIRPEVRELSDAELETRKKLHIIQIKLQDMMTETHYNECRQGYQPLDHIEMLEQDVRDLQSCLEHNPEDISPNEEHVNILKNKLNNLNERLGRVREEVEADEQGEQTEDDDRVPVKVGKCHMANPELMEIEKGLNDLRRDLVCHPDVKRLEDSFSSFKTYVESGGFPFNSKYKAHLKSKVEELERDLQQAIAS